MSRSSNDYTRYLSRGGGSTPPTPGASFTSQMGGSHIPQTHHQSPSPTTYPPDPLLAQPSAPPPTPPTMSDADHDRVIEALLDQPGHNRLPHLDPARPQGTFWFTDDGSVASRVRSILERDFKEPHANWTQTPRYIVHRWFETFAQSYHWDHVITSLVRKEFEKKLKARMCDQVGRWKSKWRKEGDNAMPRWMDPEVWKGLVAYWSAPRSETLSENARAARLSDPDGDGCHKHRSGQLSFQARARKIAETRGGDATPDLLAVLEQTKRRPDGSFVDGKSEKLYNDVTSKMQELTQTSEGDDPESTASVSPAMKNKIFTEVAPRKKGRIYGVGSLQSKIDSCTSSASSSSQSRQDSEALQTIIQSQAKIIEAQTQQMSKFGKIFNYLGTKDPDLAQLLQNEFGDDPGSGSGTGTGTGTGTGPSESF